jgi:thioesterase domain-containing protein
MSTAEFLSSLRERDVRLRVEDGRLKCDAPPGALDDALRAELAARRDELVTIISAAQSDPKAARSVVPLKPTGDLPALFARPGHNGDVFCYRPLSAHLHARRPIYAIEPKGLDGGPVAETVEAMAAYEVEQIRGVQPHGPYHLAGYCAGGSIAFESARQLAEAGEAVARVVLLGAPFPAVYRSGGGTEPVSDRMTRHATALAAASPSEGVEYVRSRLGRRVRALVAHGPADVIRRRVEKATVAAVKRYEPGFYPGRVDLFFPSEAWRESGDRPADWNRVAGAVVEHIGPDGVDGDSMLLEPNVAALAASVEACLGDEGGRHAAD